MGFAVGQRVSEGGPRPLGGVASGASSSSSLPADGSTGSKSKPRGPGQDRGEAVQELGRLAGLYYLSAFRATASEIGFYRLRRWTEPPEQYLKRRLARVLFEERGLRQVVGGGGPTLEVQLTAFEEIRVPRRMARVQVIARLHDERLVRWEES
jgi:cholesterol transport system auxiliary component